MLIQSRHSAHHKTDVLSPANGSEDGGDGWGGIWARIAACFEALKLLLEKGASLNSTAYEDASSWALFHFMDLGTALHKAAELDKVDVVNFLVNEGANGGFKDANGRTPSDCARTLSQWKVIEVLGE